jgi:hypothetical protein
MGKRGAHMSSSKTPYAVKHGQYVVAVKHVLEVFSSSVTIVFNIVVFPAVSVFISKHANFCVRLIIQISLVTCPLAQCLLCCV